MPTPCFQFANHALHDNRLAQPAPPPDADSAHHRRRSGARHFGRDRADEMSQRLPRHVGLDPSVNRACRDGARRFRRHPRRRERGGLSGHLGRKPSASGSDAEKVGRRPTTTLRPLPTTIQLRRITPQLRRTTGTVAITAATIAADCSAPACSAGPVFVESTEGGAVAGGQRRACRHSQSSWKRAQGLARLANVLCKK